MTNLSIVGVVGSWEVDPQEVVSQIQNTNDDITIEIDSVGGSVFGGFSIANAIDDHKAKGFKVDIVGGGVVASIASYLAMKGSSFTIRDNTTFMIHNAWLPIAGDFNELRKAADLSEGLSSIIAKSYTKKTSIKEDEMKDMMNKETFLFGNEIKERGFADEIKDTENDLNKSEALALNMEKLKACNNAIMQNENVSFEAVAKLIPQKEANPPEAVDVPKISAKQKRDFQIKLKGK